MAFRTRVETPASIPTVLKRCGTRAYLGKLASHMSDGDERITNCDVGEVTSAPRRWLNGLPEIRDWYTKPRPLNNIIRKINHLANLTHNPFLGTNGLISR
jgi:hypothetical protein